MTTCQSHLVLDLKPVASRIMTWGNGYLKLQIVTTPNKEARVFPRTAVLCKSLKDVPKNDPARPSMVWSMYMRGA